MAALDDGDLVTARLARERRAFAVLAHDSDYFIFPDMRGAKLVSNHAPNLYSCNPWDSTTANVYDPEEVAAFLGLDLRRMPLLASLLGNDYVNVHRLQTLHAKVLAKEGGGAGGGSSSSYAAGCVELIKALAKLIRRTEEGLKPTPESWDEGISVEEEEAEDADILETIVEELNGSCAIGYIHFHG